MVEENENWHLRDKCTQDEWHTAANAVIEEYKRRASAQRAAVVYKDRYGQSDVILENGLPEGTELFLAPASTEDALNVGLLKKGKQC